MAKSRSESRSPGIFPWLVDLNTLFVIVRSRRRRSNVEMFAEGHRKMPGPGERTTAFGHCEERSDEAISKWAACE
jgi:hypothetical protein